MRALFVGVEVFESVRGPFPENHDGYRLGQFRGTLDAFTRGSWVTISQDPYSKRAWTYFAPVDPVDLRIWDIRAIAPLPQIRCFGAWAEIDTFVALTWRWRDDIERFSEEALECRQEWDRLFPDHAPYKGESVDAYIKQRYRVS